MFDLHDLLLQTIKSVAGEVGLGVIAVLTAWRMKLWQKAKAHLQTRKARAAAQDKLVVSWPNIERVLVGYQDREARIT